MHNEWNNGQETPINMEKLDWSRWQPRPTRNLTDRNVTSLSSNSTFHTLELLRVISFQQNITPACNTRREAPAI